MFPRSASSVILAASAALAIAGQTHAQSTVVYADAENKAATLDSSSSPLTLQVAAGSATQSGVIGGSGTVVKTGAGSLTLGASNTYSGPTRVESGTLFATSAAINGGSVQLAGGTWRVNGNAQSIANPISASGASGLTFGTGSNFINGAISSEDSSAVLTIAQGGGGSNTVTFYGSLAGYAGTLALNNRFYRFQNQSGNAFDPSSGRFALWRINSGAQLSYQAGTNNNLSIQLGGLQGAGTLSGGNGAGTGFVNYQIGARGDSTTFSGTIVDGSTKTALTKTGAGSLTLSGANTYSGATVVEAGALIVAGSLGNSTLMVGAAGTLGGTGSIGGAAVVNGVLRPQAAPASAASRLVFGSTLALNGTTTFDLDGPNFSGLTVSAANALTFGGALEFNFISGLSAGSYDLFSFDGASAGDFSSARVIGRGSLTRSGETWIGSFDGYDLNFSETTGDLVVSTTAVPEPAASALLAGGALLGGAAFRRRRFRA